MLYNQVINPKTGRKVNINGKLGRQILMNYLNVLQGGASICTNYHSDPIKCQSSKDSNDKYCVYSAGKVKGEVGQCRKSIAYDVDKSKESARRRKGLEEKFLESATLRVQRRFRKKKQMDKFSKIVSKTAKKPKKNSKNKTVSCKNIPKYGRRGKCRERKDCMLTKGKKKKCVPCDYEKYDTKDKCIYK
tara:strand:+ start:555 stop:1121 length:567 start_codon:yes stop_codon:yes gene_type:complete